MKKKQSPQPEIPPPTQIKYHIPPSWPNEETCLAFELWISISRILLKPNETFPQTLTAWTDREAIKAGLIGHRRVVGEWTGPEIDAAIDHLVRSSYAAEIDGCVCFQRPDLANLTFLAEALNAAMHVRLVELLLHAIENGKSTEAITADGDPVYENLFRGRMVILSQIRNLAPDHPLLQPLDGKTDEYAWLQLYRKKIKNAGESEAANPTSFST